MSDRLSDTVAVVTGGGAGIGAATCLRLAEEGATIVAVDWHGDHAEATTDRVRARTGSESIAVETDVGNERQVERLAATVDDRFGRVDVLVNNAAIRVEPRPVTDADEESWDRIVDVNLKGVAFCTKHLVPLMDAGGSIVNVASNGAAVGRPN